MKFNLKAAAAKEKECKPLTDEEFREYQKKKADKEKKEGGVISAIFDAIFFFL